jgi:disulfide bond formation protein DsbB
MLTADARTAAPHGTLSCGAMTLVVGSALGFEHIGGYIPCALCLSSARPITSARR